MGAPSLNGQNAKSWSSSLKMPEQYFLTGVPESFKTTLNLAHFEQFRSNRVGDPFAPQNLGALALKGEKSGSSRSKGYKVWELSA